MRIGSFIFVVVGLLGACFSLAKLSGAALPYPDATAEMLSQQASSVQFWGRLLLANLLLVIAGSWGVWQTRRQQ